MNAIIDRFEGDYAIVELSDGKMLEVKKSKIPAQAEEGDVLLIEGDCISIDEMETARRKAEVEKLMKDIWE